MEAPRPDYFPALDGLRLICCLFVIAGHGMVGHPLAPSFGQLGPMGVNVFFALSGFLITTLLLRERAKSGRISLRNFYVRRVLRIFPVYYAALAVAAVGILVLGDRYLRPFGAAASTLNVPLVLGSHALFLANWVHVALPTTLDVLWSVSIEEQFYLVFPLALVVSRSARGAVGMSLVLLGLCWCVRGSMLDRPDELYRNTLAHGDHLLLGSLTALLLHSQGAHATARLKTLAALQFDLLALLGIVALAIFEARAPMQGALLFVDYVASSALCAVIVGVLSVNSSWLARVLARPFLRALGQLTYAGYVFHMYCVAVAWFIMARATSNVNVAAPLRTVLAIPLTFAVAWLSKVTIERRALFLKDRWTVG